MPQAKKSARTRVSRATKATAPVAVAHVSKYAVGDQIAHPLFGEGTVTEIDASKLTIEFSDGVSKQVLDGYVRHRP